MALEQELIDSLKLYAENMRALTEALQVQAGAIHALAESIAAATSDEPQAEVVATPSLGMYADGTPIG